MQFYDLYKDLLEYIPENLTVVKDIFSFTLPFVLLLIAGCTTFYGLKWAVAWCRVTFFMMGVTLSSAYILPEYQNSDSYMYFILLGMCIAVGIVFAFLSKYLARVQVSVTMFFLVYASLPSFIKALGDLPSRIVSATIGLALAFLSIKYRYIVTIAVTSYTSAFIFFEVLNGEFDFDAKVYWALLLGTAGLIFQCIDNRETLKKTYKELKEKAKKTKKGGEKAARYVKEKAHRNSDNTPVDADNKSNNTQNADGAPDGNEQGICGDEEISDIAEENQKKNNTESE